MSIKNYIRDKFFQHLWCPGCGHGLFFQHFRGLGLS